MSDIFAIMLVTIIIIVTIEQGGKIWNENLKVQSTERVHQKLSDDPL